MTEDHPAMIAARASWRCVQLPRLRITAGAPRSLQPPKSFARSFAASARAPSHAIAAVE